MTYTPEPYLHYSRRHFRDVVHTLDRTSDPAVELLATADLMQHVRWSPEVSVDTGDNTASSHFENTTNPLTVTGAVTSYTGCDFVAGRLFKLESEVLEVYSVSGNDVTFTRGVSGTTVASHADAVDIYTSTEADDEFRTMARTAREQLESDTERSYITQTWALYLDCWPSIIELRRPPVQSVTSIVYVDTAGSSTTWDSSEYRTDLVRFPGRIEPAYGYSYPTARSVTNAITVTFVAGDGDDRSDVCERARQACRMLGAALYCEREASSEDADRYRRTYEALIGSLGWRSPV